MSQNEVSEDSQAAYNAWIQQQQQSQEAIDECDRDLSPEERKAREEFDRDREGYNRGSGYRKEW